MYRKYLIILLSVLVLSGCGDKKTKLKKLKAERDKLTQQIVSVNDSTDKETISKFVLNLPIMDSKFIRNTLSECEPKLELERKLNAPSGEEVTVRVTFGVEFFRPFF